MTSTTSPDHLSWLISWPSPYPPCGPTLLFLQKESFIIILFIPTISSCVRPLAGSALPAMPGYDLPSHYWNHEAPWKLEGNQVLPSFRLAYETWGSLSKGRDNAVLFLHALSGSSHAFSSSLSSQPGWWDGLLDDDSPIQPRTHFIICANLLGGCYGSTGPSSVDPHSGIRYGARFPQIT